tara:strand:+ start:719 stop:898 length:180 start_codon:yes stop_codon:yes gene_type:complete
MDRYYILGFSGGPGEDYSGWSICDSEDSAMNPVAEIQGQSKINLIKAKEIADKLNKAAA